MYVCMHNKGCLCYVHVFITRDGCTYTCMHACMYACTCTHVHIVSTFITQTWCGQYNESHHPIGTLVCSVIKVTTANSRLLTGMQSGIGQTRSTRQPQTTIITAPHTPSQVDMVWKPSYCLIISYTINGVLYFSYL